MYLKLYATSALVLLGALVNVNGLRLKKVVVLSRHNIRAPLEASLKKLSSKKWPKWNAEPGHLTAKGARLEGFMGEYFSEWLRERGLFSDCSEKKSVYVFANSLQRTINTAKAFTEAAFPNCGIIVNYNKTSYPGYDHIFKLAVKNDTKANIARGVREMRQKLNEINLRDVYANLNKMADIRNADCCKSEGYCDLTEDKDKIVFHPGSAPLVDGRFQIGGAMVDAFIMSYYDGYPLEEVAWGEIKNENQWEALTQIANEDQNVRFNLTVMKEETKPIVKYLKDALNDGTKFTFIAGHDANIRTLVSRLGFKRFVLPEQFELTPIGGKLVFQVWSDGVEDFVKMEYVYQSWKQIRASEKLSLKNPPKNITMYLESCVVNDAGMCSWTVFETVLNNFIQ